MDVTEHLGARTRLAGASHECGGRGPSPGAGHPLLSSGWAGRAGRMWAGPRTCGGGSSAFPPQGSLRRRMLVVRWNMAFTSKACPKCDTYGKRVSRRAQGRGPHPTFRCLICEWEGNADPVGALKLKNKWDRTFSACRTLVKPLRSFGAVARGQEGQATEERLEQVGLVLARTEPGTRSRAPVIWRSFLRRGGGREAKSFRLCARGSRACGPRDRARLGGHGSTRPTRNQGREPSPPRP